jgi:hypothetical protein
VESGGRTPLLLRCMRDAPAVVSLPPRRVVTAIGHRPSRRGHGPPHVVLWFEDEQIPPPKPETRELATRISARENMFMLMDRVCLGGRNSVQAVVLISD